MSLTFIIYPMFCLLPAVFLAAAIIQNPGAWRFAPLVYFALLTIVLGLERVKPWERSWVNSRNGDSRLDIMHLAGNLMVSHSAVAIYFVLFFLREALPRFRGLLDSHLALQFVIGLLIFDFGLYIIHRLSHSSGFLWRLHAIHHSSERVYSINGQKRHLLHEVFEGLPGLVVLWLIGIRPEIAALIIATVSIHLLFQHANISYRLGPGIYIFAAAELHRWHHQRDWKEVQGNYGAVFSIWDWIFRTNLPQKGEASIQVGLDEEPALVRASYFNQHTWPFLSKDKKPK